MSRRVGEAFAGIEVPDGEPGGLRSASRQFDAAGAVLSDAAGEVAGYPGSVSSWTGIASVVYAGSCFISAAALGSAATAMASGSRAAATYADALDEAQDDARAAIDDARAAQDRIDRAQAELEEAQTAAAVAGLRIAAANTELAITSALGSPSASAESDRAQAIADADAAADRAARARRELEDARADLERAKKRGKRAMDAAKDAARAAAAAFGGITAASPIVNAGPPAGAEPPGGRAMVPDPAEAPLDRLFGRDYVLPEEAANVVLEMGYGSAAKGLLKKIGIGASKAGPPRTRIVPGGGLKAHEGVGRGHTLARHVGLTDDMLRARLTGSAGTKPVNRASTFFDRATAEDAVSGALTANATRVQLFLGSNKARTEIVQEFDRAIGRSIGKGESAVSEVSKVKVILVKDSSKLGYHVRTAFPE
jgi:CDI toxin RNase A-like protein